jgi:hypothetical protein
MATLIRLLLGLFGIRVDSRRRWCGVTNTIEALPGTKFTQQVLGGTLHVFPVILLLLYIYFRRLNSWALSGSESIALLLACSWTFVGPQLIWYYETVSIRKFVVKYRHLIEYKMETKALRRALYSSIYEMRINVVFTTFWVCVLAAGYWSSLTFVAKLIGNNELFRDWLFYVLSFGVLLISYYTSIGFCYAFKTVYITLLLAKCKLNNNIYYHDGVFGLSCVGNLAFQTSLMFSTGWLFAPLIILIGQHNGNTALMITYLMLFTYFMSTVVTFMIPVYLIHWKLYESKEILIKNFYVSANRAYSNNISKWSEASQKQFDFYEKAYARIRSIPSWPLNFDATLKLLTTSILVPTLVGLVSVYLKGTSK